MNIIFDEDAWEDYLHWQKVDPRRLRKLNALIAECARTPFSGTGKPEALRDDFSGWWSRRTDEEHRLIYRMKGGDVLIAQCRYHYHK